MNDKELARRELARQGYPLDDATEVTLPAHDDWLVMWRPWPKHRLRLYLAMIPNPTPDGEPFLQIQWAVPISVLPKFKAPIELIFQNRIEWELRTRIYQ